MADIQAASERLRILIRAMHSGGPHSSLLSSALYDDFILLILGKLVGEGQPANLLGASACWLDAIAGCRLEDFTEAREAADVALLKTFTEAEQKACIAGMNVEALLDVAAVTSASARPAGASVAQLQESLFADVGRTARTFLLGPEILPPATKLILDATAGTAPSPLGPVQRELFTRTEPLLAVLQANADRLTAGEFVMLPPMDTITNPRRAGAGGKAAAAAANSNSWPNGVYVALQDLLVCYFVHFAVSGSRRVLERPAYQRVAPNGTLVAAAAMPSSVLPYGPATSAAYAAVHDGLPLGASDAICYQPLQAFFGETPYLGMLFRWFDTVLPTNMKLTHPLKDSLMAAVQAYWLLHNPPAMVPLPGEETGPQLNALGVSLGLPSELRSGSGAAAGGFAGPSREMRCRYGPAGVPSLAAEQMFGAGAQAGGGGGAGGVGNKTAAVTAGGAAGAPVEAAGFGVVAQPRYTAPSLLQMQALIIALTMQQCDAGFPDVVAGRAHSGQGGPALAQLAKDVLLAVSNTSHPGRRAPLLLPAHGIQYAHQLLASVPASAAAGGLHGAGAAAAAGAAAGGQLAVPGAAGGGPLSPTGAGGLLSPGGGAAWTFGQPSSASSPLYSSGAGGAWGHASSSPMHSAHWGTASGAAAAAAGLPTPSGLRDLPGPQLFPQALFELQHPLFTFLRVHMSKLNPLVAPALCGHVIDLWLMVLTPWRARDRHKHTAGIMAPVAAARCYDYTGQALRATAELVQERQRGAPAGGPATASTAAAGGRVSALAVGDRLRANDRFAAAVAATHDFERAAVWRPAFEDWRPYIAQHYAFYTFLLRAALALLERADFAAGHPSYALEALERVLDVFEPCVLEELRVVGAVVDSLFGDAAAAVGSGAAAAAYGSAGSAGASVGAGASRGGAGSRGVGGATTPGGAGASAGPAPLALQRVRATTGLRNDAIRVRVLAHAAALQLPPAVHPRRVLLSVDDEEVASLVGRVGRRLRAARDVVPCHQIPGELRAAVILEGEAAPSLAAAAATGVGAAGSGGGAVPPPPALGPMLARQDSAKHPQRTALPSVDFGLSLLTSSASSVPPSTPLVADSRGAPASTGLVDRNGDPVPVPQRWVPSVDRLQFAWDRLVIAFAPPPPPVQHHGGFSVGPAGSPTPAGGAGGAGAGAAAAGAGGGGALGYCGASAAAVRSALRFSTVPSSSPAASFTLGVPYQLTQDASFSAHAPSRGLLGWCKGLVSAREWLRCGASWCLWCVHCSTGLSLRPAPPLRDPWAPETDLDLVLAGGGGGSKRRAAGVSDRGDRTAGAAAGAEAAEPGEDRSAESRFLDAFGAQPLATGLLTRRGKIGLLQAQSRMTSASLRFQEPDALRPPSSHEHAWLVEATARANGRLLALLGRATGWHFGRSPEEVRQLAELLYETSDGGSAAAVAAGDDAASDGVGAGARSAAATTRGTPGTPHALRQQLQHAVSRTPAASSRGAGAGTPSRAHTPFVPPRFSLTPAGSAAAGGRGIAASAGAVTAGGVDIDTVLAGTRMGGGQLRERYIRALMLPPNYLRPIANRRLFPLLAASWVLAHLYLFGWTPAFFLMLGAWFVVAALLAS